MNCRIRRIERYQYYTQLIADKYQGVVLCNVRDDIKER